MNWIKTWWLNRKRLRFERKMKEMVVLGTVVSAHGDGAWARKGDNAD